MYLCNPFRTGKGKPKIIDNTERDNEVKKKKRLSLISKFEFFRVARWDYNFRQKRSRETKVANDSRKRK